RAPFWGLVRRKDTMSGLEALQSVQFVTAHGKRFAVLSADDWEALIDWLETLEDTRIARQAYAELQAAGGDRKRAGWLEWDAVADELGVSAAAMRADPGCAAS